MALIPRIAAIGDSFIYGRQDAPGGGWITRLRHRLEEIDIRSAVFNLGLGGDTSTDVLRRAKFELKPREPNSVIIGVGANDARRHKRFDAGLATSRRRFQCNLAKLIHVAQVPPERIFLASVTPVDETLVRPLADYFYSNEDMKATWEIQRSFCAKHGTTFLDFWGTIESSDSSNYSDGLHLNSSGHEQLFRAAWPQISKVLDCA